MWMHYYALFPVRVYEGDMASQVQPLPAQAE
jgi:hypothetical protein